MERRASPRRTIQLNASLTGPTGRNYRIQVLDFCSGGLFFQLSPNQSDGRVPVMETGVTVGFRTGDSVRVAFSDVLTAREYVLEGQVVRLMPEGAAIKLMQPNPAAIGSLLRIAAAENLQGETRVRPGNAISNALRGEIRKRVDQHIRPLMQSAVEALPDALMDAASVARSDTDQNRIADAATLTRQQGRRLIQVAMEALPRLMQPASAVTFAGTPGQQPDSGLSLVGKDEFEDWLILKVMSTRAETRYRNLLLQLKLRLDAADVGALPGHHPVGPAVICHAFREAIKPLEQQLDVEKVCYQVFEKEVLQQLEPLYETLNSYLIESGVLPDLDLSRYMASVGDEGAGAPARPAEPVSEPETGQDSTETPEEAPVEDASVPVRQAFTQTRATHQARSSIHSELASARQSFSSVRNLFRQLDQLRAARPSSAPEEAVPVVEQEQDAVTSDELIDTLAPTQPAPAVDVEALENRQNSLKARLRRAFATGKMKPLTPKQDEAVDVVDQFFMSMLQSPRVTDMAKSQIRSLELPLLRLLLRNPEFFEDRNAPARKVINRLAQIGVKGSRLSPVNVQRVNALVTRIQQEAANDPDVFESVLTELDDLVERQNLLYRRNVERVTAAAEGQQKVDLAKHAVREAIARRIAGKQVPKALVTLLDGGWRDLLILTHIRQGEGSEAWQNYLSVIDLLMDFAEDASTPVNLRDLLALIQEGLATISSSHLPSGHIRDALKNFLVREPDAPVEKVDMPEEPVEEEASPEAIAGEARKAGLQRWLNRAQQLRTGDWLQLRKPEDNEPQFIRLVWIGRHFSRYVFVNHQGMKVVELDPLTLARYLRDGIAVPDPEHDREIVDESLDNMVKNLYEQLSFASTHDELTGVMHRKEFERQLGLIIEQRNPEEAVQVALVSLEGFRLINDSFGFEAGDAVLKELAGRIQAFCDEKELVARFSGDEFVLALEGDPIARLESLLDAVTGKPVQYKDERLSVKAVAGYVTCAAGQASASQMIASAKSAADKAARSERRILAGELDDQSRARKEAILAEVARISEQLDNERLLLRCQKIIPLKADTALGPQYEILLSVHDSQGQLIPAAEFVRAAEQYNRMQDVDRWVVGRVLDWMVSNRQKIEDLGGVSINLSGHSLNDEVLLEYIFEKLTRFDCPLDKITFEITEASAITRLHDVIDFINELREYGAHFCLGNFGTGVSAMQFLKQLPVDMIKIDGSFIRDLHTDKNDQLMVRSMTEMAHFMGKEVVAPQVEHRDVMTLLKMLKIDYAQGYHIERPRQLDTL
ncbi:MAG: DUF1631 family protein [Gammaproteobacteria bacterium]|nr:MAG: DUF1631 family protein [Gammaproteobacteria bacterium]